MAKAWFHHLISTTVNKFLFEIMSWQLQVALIIVAAVLSLMLVSIKETEITTCTRPVMRIGNVTIIYPLYTYFCMVISLQGEWWLYIGHGPTSTCETTLTIHAGSSPIGSTDYITRDMHGY